MKKKPQKGHKKRNLILAIVIVILTFPLYFGWSTPAPKGTSFISPPSTVSGIRLLYDLSYQKNGKEIHDQTILGEEIRMIGEAKQFIVADLFLYNDYYNTKKYQFPPSTQRLTDALIAQKKKYPDLKAYLITDEINDSYGPELNRQFQELEKNGIKVIVTDSSKIRDSNPLYAAYYRAYFSHLGQAKGGWLKNPFGDNGPKVNLRNYLRILNFKANHRKVLITDQGAVISSSNPHDGSTYHSNIAFQFGGEAVKELLEAEKAVAAFSGTEIKDVEYKLDSQTAFQDARNPENSNAAVRPGTEVRVVTEDKIRGQVMDAVKSAGPGDRIDLGMFYLAHREIISQLIQASDRGADIRVIFDPNKDAFGYKKNGVPNRQAAAELIKRSGGKIQVRWYMTHGEQYHTKIIAVYQKDKAVLIGGSANYTRRNLDNYNLEADLAVTVKPEDPLAQDFSAYYDRIWNNQDGEYTGEYSVYEDNSLWKRAVYRFQEKTGLSTF